MGGPGRFAWVTEIEVGGWEELQSVLLGFTAVEAGGHRRSGCLFRGMAEASWRLATGLERLGTPPEAIEAAALRAFAKYAPIGSYRIDSSWERLAVAQHNGLPTRLLDWTVSPLIAAHFATAQPAHARSDGVVWAVDAWAYRDLMPSQMREILETRWTFDVHLLDELFPQLDDFDRLAGDTIVFFEPPSIDARIENQYAVFSLLNGSAKSHHTVLESLAADHPHLVYRIVIPAEAKAEIRSLLDHNNITERVLFPGLPGLCDWLRRYYSPA